MKYQGIIALFFLLVTVLIAGCLDNIKGSGTGGIEDTGGVTGVVLKYDSTLAEVNVVACPNAAVYVSDTSKTYTELADLNKMTLYSADASGNFNIPDLLIDKRHNLAIDYDRDGLVDEYDLDFHYTTKSYKIMSVKKGVVNEVLDVVTDQYSIKSMETMKFTVKGNNLTAGRFYLKVASVGDDINPPVWISDRKNLAVGNIQHDFLWEVPVGMIPTEDVDDPVDWFVFLYRDDIMIRSTNFYVEKSDDQPIISGSILIEDGVETIDYTDVTIRISISSDKLKYVTVSNNVDMTGETTVKATNGGTFTWQIGDVPDGYYTVYAKFKDEVGNFYPITNDSITIYRAPPSKPVLKSYPNLETLATRLSVTNLAVANIKSMQIYRTNTSSFDIAPANYLAQSVTLDYEDDTVLKDKDYFYRVTVTDLADKDSAPSDVFQASYREFVYINSADNAFDPNKGFNLLNDDLTHDLKVNLSIGTDYYLYSTVFSKDGKIINCLVSPNGTYDPLNSRVKSLYQLSSDGNSTVKETVSTYGDIAYFNRSYDSNYLMCALNAEPTYDMYYLAADTLVATRLFDTPLTNEVTVCIDPTGVKIAFSTDTGKSYSIKTDGTGIKFLGNGIATDWIDDTKILYHEVAADKIHLIDSDGTNDNVIINNGKDARYYNVDGQEGIIYLKNTANGYQIYKADINGAGETQITTSAGDKFMGSYR